MLTTLLEFTTSPNIAREPGNVAVRSLGLTQLWTESHSGLWLEGRASQAQSARMLHQLLRKIGQAFIRPQTGQPQETTKCYAREHPYAYGFHIVINDLGRSRAIFGLVVNSVKVVHTG